MNIVYPHVATYWGAPVPTGFGGHSFAAPVAVSVRWEEKMEEFTDEQGSTKLSRAVVFAPIDLEVGGYLLLGTSATADPTAVNGSLPIQRYAKIPDIRAVEYVRKAWL